MEKKTEEHIPLVQMLYGGLRGRFAQSFCVLQGDLDAIERVLLQRADPSLRRELLPLLRDVACRLPALERLADQTAEIALGSAMRTVHRQEAMDLAVLMEELTMDINNELSRRGSAAAVALEKTRESVPVVGDSSLICALFSNILSNALGAKSDAHLSWKLTGESLICRDDGPGLPEAYWPLLLAQPQQADLPFHAGTGLLLIRQYADCLGWTIVRQEDGICFQMPPFPEEQRMMLSSVSGGQLAREQARHAVCRELDALQMRETENLPV